MMKLGSLTRILPEW